MSDSDTDLDDTSSMMTGSSQSEMMEQWGVSAMTGSSAGAANFSELMPGKDGKTVSQVTTDSYDVLYGSWPQAYDEVVLVLNRNSGISAGTLYQLGLITEEQYDAAVEKIEAEEEAEEICLDYEEVCGHTFYLVAACDHYSENETARLLIWKTVCCMRKS